MRRRFGDLTNLEEISRVSWAGHGWLRGGLFAASLVCMIVGLARPQLLSRDVRPVPKATDVIFMLDTSPSMFATDMDPNRLGRAEQIIQQFILHKLPEDRYALVGFNYNGVILSYLTRDPQTILVYFDYLNRTTEPGIGTNMGAALVSALRVIDADEQITPENRDRRRILVLISDGDDTIGQWEEPIDDVVRRQLKLYTFGLGTASGRRLPARALAARRRRPLCGVCQPGSACRSKAEATTLRELADADRRAFLPRRGRAAGRGGASKRSCRAAGQWPGTSRIRSGGICISISSPRHSSVCWRHIPIGTSRSGLWNGAIVERT